jgi:hypothetical protein
MTDDHRARRQVWLATDGDVVGLTLTEFAAVVERIRDALAEVRGPRRPVNQSTKDTS